jgi:hypothetical protein
MVTIQSKSRCSARISAASTSPTMYILVRKAVIAGPLLRSTRIIWAPVASMSVTTLPDRRHLMRAKRGQVLFSGPGRRVILPMRLPGNCHRLNAGRMMIRPYRAAVLGKRPVFLLTGGFGTCMLVIELNSTQTLVLSKSQMRRVRLWLRKRKFRQIG